MFNTLQSMRRACPKNVEIINYEHARIVTTHGSGIDDILERVDAIKDEAKEDHDVTISAKITGNEKDIVLIQGIGKMFDLIPDAFKSIMRAASPSDLDEQPLFQKFSDMKIEEITTKARSKPLSKPLKKKTDDDAVDEGSENQEDEPIAPSAPKSKPVVKKKEADAPNAVLDNVISYLKKNDNLKEFDDVASKVSEDLGIDREDAKKQIMASIKDSNGKVSLDDGILWYDE